MALDQMSSKTFASNFEHNGMHEVIQMCISYTIIPIDEITSRAKCIGIADILGMEIDRDQFPELVDALTLDSMQKWANETAPESHLGLWKSAELFFAMGGPCDWSLLLTSKKCHTLRRTLLDL